MIYFLRPFILGYCTGKDELRFSPFGALTSHHHLNIQQWEDKPSLWVVFELACSTNFCKCLNSHPIIWQPIWYLSWKLKDSPSIVSPRSTTVLAAITSTGGGAISSSDDTEFKSESSPLSTWLSFQFFIENYIRPVLAHTWVIGYPAVTSVTLASDLNVAQMGITVLSTKSFTNRFHAHISWKYSIVIHDIYMG